MTIDFSAGYLGILTIYRNNNFIGPAWISFIYRKKIVSLLRDLSKNSIVIELNLPYIKIITGRNQTAKLHTKILLLN
jgi:hypothetical protein